MTTNMTLNLYVHRHAYLDLSCNLYHCCEM